MEREYRIDVIRLISTFLVVVIHLSNYFCRYLPSVRSTSFAGSLLFDVLGRVSVPLFFMISGALTLGRDVSFGKLFRKIGHFVTVLVIWTAVYIIFDILYMGYEFKASDYMNLPFKELKPHLWFMYAIIALYFISPLANILVKNMTRQQKKYFIYLWFFFAGIVPIIQIAYPIFGVKAISIEFAVPIIQDTYYLGYFIVGRLLYEEIKSGELKIKRSLCWISLSVSLALVYVISLIICSVANAFSSKLLAYRSIFIIFASLATFILIMTMPDIKSSRIKKVLGTLSPILFGVYLTHIIWFDLLIREFDILCVNGFIGVPVFSFLVFLVSLGVVFILNKIPGVRRIIN